MRGFGKVFRSLGRALRIGRRGVPGCDLAGRVTRADVEQLEARMLARPQLVAKIVHRFAPGVYLRTAIMEPGDYLGHEHLTEHFNIVTTGRALLIPLDARGGIAGPGREVGAGDIFAVTPGERKLVRVLETCTWTNVHPTTETDLEKIEAKFIRKSATWQHHAAALTQKDSPCLG